MVAVNYRLASAEVEYALKDSAPDVLVFDEEKAEVAGKSEALTRYSLLRLHRA